jgi:TRAP-type mannitol/chloroaromatic compound transport system permease small subunit
MAGGRQFLQAKYVNVFVFYGRQRRRILMLNSVSQVLFMILPFTCLALFYSTTTVHWTH